MTLQQRYPELRGFTERLLEGLTEVLVADQAGRDHAAATPPARPHGRGTGQRQAGTTPATMRRSLQRVAMVAALAAIGVAGLRLAGDGHAPGPESTQAGGVRAEAALLPVRSLEDVALVAARQPVPPRPGGPVTSTLREEIHFGTNSDRVKDGPPRFDFERRVTTVRRSDGSIHWEYGPPKVTFPSAGDKARYERWAARHTGRPPKPGMLWPTAYVFDVPASADGAREFAEAHDDNRRIGVFQASGGEMAGGLLPAELPTDSAKLHRAILEAIEPFAAASSAERDLIGKVGTRRELLVSVVEELLTDERVTPAQRAAAFRMLQKVRGVTVVPDAADLAGRKGIGIRWDDTRNGPSNPVLWVFDRTASRLLGISSMDHASDGGQPRYGSVILRNETTR